jgi:hypothetical protein
VEAVTQEFGTFPGPVVALALVKENQAWWTVSQEESFGARVVLRDTFCPSSQVFAERVIKRGVTVLHQSLA